LNWAIKKLTGNSLFDEKMGGTIHVALGDNIVFGHSIQSHIHEDLVIKKPTLILDDTIIIDKGKFKASTIKKLRKKFKPPSLLISDNSIISFVEAKIFLTETKVKRRLNKGKRISFIDIMHKGGQQLSELIRNLKVDELPYQSFKKKARGSLKEEDLKKLLEMLSHYEMITINNKP